MFLVYISFVITITFFYPVRERTVKTYEYHFIPLQNIIAQAKDSQQYNTPGYWKVFTKSIAGNFLLFVPIGFMLHFFINEKHISIWLYCLAFSLLIELIQLIFHLGVCDIDDVILNSSGAFAGIALCNALHLKNSFERI